MNKILSKPAYGWSDLNLKDENGEELRFRISYLDDAPQMFLDMIESEKNVCLEFEAEGYEWVLVWSRYYIYVILEKDETEFFKFDITPLELSHEIIKCLEEDLEEWATFSCKYSSDDEDHVKTKAINDLKLRLSEAKKHLK